MDEDLEVEGEELLDEEAAEGPPPVDPRLLELAEEPGLWLPPEPTRLVFRGEGFATVFSGRSAWVQRVRIEEEQIQLTVDRVDSLLGVKELPGATWWLGELTTPPGLAERLLELGFEPDDPPTMTSLMIESPPAGEPAVEVRRVETLEDALQASEIDWECFDVPEEERERRRGEAATAWPILQADGRQSVYIAYIDGEPVGFGRAVFTMFGAVLLGGATLPQARGHGVYSSLVHARWQEAVERNVPRIAVSAGPLSAPILQSLGFEPIGTVTLLRQNAT